MKKLNLTIAILFFSLVLLAQKKDTTSIKKDTTPKVAPAQEIYLLPDTILFKIPVRLRVTFENILNDNDYSHKEYIEILTIYNEQARKQLIKKKK